MTNLIKMGGLISWKQIATSSAALYINVNSCCRNIVSILKYLCRNIFNSVFLKSERRRHTFLTCVCVCANYKVRVRSKNFDSVFTPELTKIISTSPFDPLTIQSEEVKLSKYESYSSFENDDMGHWIWLNHMVIHNCRLWN